MRLVSAAFSANTRQIIHLEHINFCDKLWIQNLWYSTCFCFILRQGSVFFMRGSPSRYGFLIQWNRWTVSNSSKFSLQKRNFWRYRCERENPKNYNQFSIALQCFALVLPFPNMMPRNRHVEIRNPCIISSTEKPRQIGIFPSGSIFSLAFQAVILIYDCTWEFCVRWVMLFCG